MDGTWKVGAGNEGLYWNHEKSGAKLAVWNVEGDGIHVWIRDISTVAQLLVWRLFKVSKVWNRFETGLNVVSSHSGLVIQLWGEERTHLQTRNNENSWYDSFCSVSPRNATRFHPAPSWNLALFWDNTQLLSLKQTLISFIFFHFLLRQYWISTIDFRLLLNETSL